MKERIDWNGLWQEEQVKEPSREDLVFWDDFASHFRKKIEEGQGDPYIDQFYELSEFEKGETIFDMGCASGTLAIPYAQRGHEIWAADFSTQMLKYLMISAEEAGVQDRIHPILLDWNEDWTKRSDLPRCDVAISSRSMIAWDLSKALRDLESVAKDRVCIGAWDVPGESYDRYVAAHIGYDRPGFGCYGYIMNELMERDLFPQLRWIHSPFRLTRFESPDQAMQRLAASFRYGLSEEQEEGLRAYCRDHLVRYEEKGKEYWRLDHPNMSTIAHIMWKVRRRGRPMRSR